jgi:hypothetical protein
MKLNFSSHQAAETSSLSSLQFTKHSSPANLVEWHIYLAYEVEEPGFAKHILGLADRGTCPRSCSWPMEELKGQSQILPTRPTTSSQGPGELLAPSSEG